MTEQIFVYGTLRPPQANTTAADTHFYPQIQGHIKSQRSASLADAILHDFGDYPGIRPKADDDSELTPIQGDLLTLNPEALQITDEIEGHPELFTREVATVETSDGPTQAWVYWANPTHAEGRPIIPNGNWFNRPDSELREHVERFAQESCSWLSTVRPDGRAHLSPMWHVWYRGRAYINTPATSVKVANIKQNPSVSISHPDPSNVFLIEGTAVEANHLQAALQPLFQAKYDWDITTDNEYNTVVEITPTKLITWNNSPAKRWRKDQILQVW